MMENNSDFQTDGSSQDRGHNALSASTRSLLVCRNIWDHEPSRGAQSCFQLTNEVRSSKAACRSQLLCQEQAAEWSYTRRYQDVF